MTTVKVQGSTEFIGKVKAYPSLFPDPNPGSYHCGPGPCHSKTKGAVIVRPHPQPKLYLLCFILNLPYIEARLPSILN